MKDAADIAIEFRKVAYELNGGRELLHDVNLQVQRGETLVLLNRLLSPTSGEVLVNARSTAEWDVIRLRRMVGYVIQDAGLLPHYTVERNIGLVPSIEGWAAQKIRDRVLELLALVGLESEIAARYPRELSGGQRQRVGVARALAADPPFLLMDEPFGALDPITRAELQKEFVALQARLKKTVVFVTHDLPEALSLASRIVLLEEGRVIAIHTPMEFLASKEPLASAYVAAFSAGDHWNHL